MLLLRLFKGKKSFPLRNFKYKPTGIESRFLFWSGKVEGKQKKGNGDKKTRNNLLPK